MISEHTDEMLKLRSVAITAEQFDKLSVSTKAQVEKELKNDNIEVIPDVLVVILQGDDGRIEQGVAADISMLKHFFTGVKVREAKTMDIRNQQSLIESLRAVAQKNVTKLVLWYTGHGINVGSASPSFKLKQEHANAQTVFDSIKDCFDLCVVVVDACNSFEFQSQRPSVLKSNVENPLSSLFQVSGNAIAFSSAYGIPSHISKEGSFYTRSLINNLCLKHDWNSAFYFTRAELYLTQQPVHTSTIVKKPSNNNLELYDFE